MKINRIRFSIIGAGVSLALIILVLLSYPVSSLFVKADTRFIFFYPGIAGGANGSGAAVISPDRRVAVISSGPVKVFDRMGRVKWDDVAISTAVSDSLFKLGFATIDKLFLTTLSPDRIGGAATIVDKMNVKVIYSQYKIAYYLRDGILTKKEFYKLSKDYKLKSSSPENTLKYLTFKYITELAHKKGVKFVRVGRGDIVKLGKYVKLMILNPPLKNNKLKGYQSNEMVIKAINGKVSALFTGGIDGFGMKDIYTTDKDKLDSDIMEIPNYGEDFSNEYKYIKAISPKAAVLQYYYERGRKLKPEVMDRYVYAGIPVYNIEDCGAVIVHSTGKSYKITTTSPKSMIRLHPKRKDGIPIGKVDKKNALEVAFIDVGWGDSTFVKSPDGKTMLIDGGNWGDEEFAPNSGENIILPFLKKRKVDKLDYVVVTHAHADHVGGIPAVMKEMKVGTIIDSGVPTDSQAYRFYVSYKNKHKIPYIKAKPGMKLNLGKDIQAEILAPLRKYKSSGRYNGLGSDLNNGSVVIKIIYKDVSYLLDADIEEEAEKDLLKKYKPEDLKAYIIHVPHHGSKYSSTKEFLSAVNPEIAVVSVSKWNRFGHPRDEALNRYRMINCKIYRTDFDGDVYTYTDGKKIQMITEK